MGKWAWSVHLCWLLIVETHEQSACKHVRTADGSGFVEIPEDNHCHGTRSRALNSGTGGTHSPADPPGT